MAYLYENDILNRWAGHTLTSTTTGHLVLWELKDANNALVGSSKGFVGKDEVTLKTLRTKLGVDALAFPCTTTPQRVALGDKTIFLPVWDITLEKVMFWDGSNWTQ